MYTIGICDDCKQDIEKLKKTIKEAGDCPDNMFIYEYESGNNLLKDIERYHHLLFIDMQMPGLNGNETAKEIRKKNQDAVVVFCSESNQLTPEMFKVRPFRYLIKQIDENEMQKDINEILREMIQKVKIPYLTTRYNGEIMRIRIDGIVYVSIYQKQTKIYITRKEKVRIGFDGETDKGRDGIINMKKLDDLKAELEKYGFGCAHKSYLVNFAHIIKKDREKLELVENIKLNCSRSREKVFREKYLEYLGYN